MLVLDLANLLFSNFLQESPGESKQPGIFSPPQFLEDGIPYMNEVQEKILSQHLLAGSLEVSR